MKITKGPQAPTSLLLLLAAMLTGCSQPAPQESMPEPAPIVEGYFESNDGARLYYADVAGPGPTVIAVHGGPGNDSAYLRPDLAPLSRLRRVVFYDQRGGGRSELVAESERLSIEHHVQDLERLRQHLQLDRLTLLAHSFGPLLAASYAIAHPDRVERMVFIGPLPPRRADVFERFQATVNARLEPAERDRLQSLWQQLTEGEDPREACRQVWAIALKPRFADPQRTHLLKGDLCSATPEAIRHGMATTNPATMSSLGAWDLRAALADVSAPTLVIHGDAEAIALDLVQEWTTALPDCRLLPIADAAHFPYVEQPDVVWPAIEQFLGGAWPAGAR